MLATTRILDTTFSSPTLVQWLSNGYGSRRLGVMACSEWGTRGMLIGAQVPLK